MRQLPRSWTPPEAVPSPGLEPSFGRPTASPTAPPRPAAPAQHASRSPSTPRRGCAGLAATSSQSTAIGGADPPPSAAGGLAHQVIVDRLCGLPRRMPHPRFIVVLLL